MKRLFRVFSVVLGVVALLMLASPCYSHTGGGGGHSSGGHAYSGARGYHGPGFHGRGFYGRGFYGYRNRRPGWWGAGGWPYYSWGASDYGGYPYDYGNYPVQPDYPYQGGYSYNYGGGYPYNYGYYPAQPGYPYQGGYPYDSGYNPEKDEYSKLNAQSTETQKADQQTLEQKYSDSKEMLVLEPTWVISGETTRAFDGNLRIVIHKASGKDECQKDSAAVSYLTSDTDVKKLCLLRTGEAENFTYQGKNYLFNLSGIAAQASVYRYYISISSLEQ